MHAKRSIGGMKGVNRAALVIVAVVMSAIVAVRTQPRPSQVSSVRLYVFDCGTLIRGEPTGYRLTRADVPDTNFADPCFLIAHPKGTLIWDVGIIPDAQIPAGGIELSAGRGSNRNVARRSLTSQLAEVGYRPSDMTYLAVSHRHADHVANANSFANATWLVQKSERDAMFAPEADKSAAFATYSALKNSKTVELTGDHDVFGDGSVVLKSTPGHTAGHQSLFVKLARTGPVLLSGDLYHYQAERTLKRIPVNDNQEQTAASRAAIEKLVAESRGQLWIQHDIVAYGTLKKAPLYYD